MSPLRALGLVRRLDAIALVVLLGATLAYAAVVVGVALTSAQAQRDDARRGSVEQARAELAVLAAFTPRLLTSDAPLRAAQRGRIDASWARLVAHKPRMLRIWRADGRLLYRSPGAYHHHGPPFTPGAAPRRPWTAEDDGGPGELTHLDVYVPASSGGRVEGVVELAQPLAPLLAHEDAQAAEVVRHSGAIGAVLWLLMLPVWLRLASLVGRAWDPRGRALLRRVRRGIRAGELEVHYQPKMNVTSGELEGAEALVRWRRDGALIPPAAFLPVVEQSPLLRELTLFVLDTALGDVRRWERAGLHVGIAVNVAPVSLSDPRLVDDVAHALGRHGVHPERLTLEVTETAVLDDDAGAGAMLERLAGLGVTLSVDDFGTGHSSLSRVTRHPFTELKIDRSFVAQLTSERRPVVATMVRLAKTLGLRVVAEGVEDDATLNALHALGCDVAQGYLLGRPAPADQLAGAVRALPELSRAAAGVRALLDGVRESLDLDAAFIAEFVGDEQVFRWTTGDSRAFETAEGASQALSDSYCARVVDGVLPNLITDAQHHATARELPVTRRSAIGAYIGVPLHRPDGTLYGTVCGLARIPRPDLTTEQVSDLAEFGRRISPLLHHAHLAVSAGRDTDR